MSAHSTTHQQKKAYIHTKPADQHHTHTHTHKHMHITYTHSVASEDSIRHRRGQPGHENVVVGDDYDSDILRCSRSRLDRSN